MATCFICPPGDDAVPDAEIVDHLRVVHPDMYGDGFDCWPDGKVVIVDLTLEPEDFTEDGAPGVVR